jgi:uncharacterized protein YjbI with pentapeptide repeats
MNIRLRFKTGFCFVLLAVAITRVGWAEIDQWEYVNPADPSQGKQQSSTMCPDGQGDPVPGGVYQYLNLTQAYLAGADMSGAYGDNVVLTNAYLYQANLSGGNWVSADFSSADFTQANLSGGDFTFAHFGGAVFTDANVQGAKMIDANGLIAAQIYSTASYTNHNLSGLLAQGLDFTGGDFSGQNLTNVDFLADTFDSADFTNADIRGANITLTEAQLDSTASFKNHDLTGLHFLEDGTGWNLSGLNLSNCVFYDTTLTGTQFTGSQINGANFGYATLSGFTQTQLKSTASYQNHDLSGVDLSENDLSGWNFTGQKLSGTSFVDCTLTGTTFDGADVRGANFTLFDTSKAGLAAAQLYSTGSYQSHDLSGIGLSGVNLSGWDFSGQNLTGASLSFTKVDGANFKKANLTNAFLSGSSLVGANFCSAIGHGADFSLTALNNAKFIHADFSGAKFDGAYMDNTDFTGANLSGATFGYDSGSTTMYFVSFRDANLQNTQFDSYPNVDVDMSGADLRGGPGPVFFYATNPITYNTIGGDGSIVGGIISLAVGQTMYIRNYAGTPAYGTGPIPIYVNQSLSMQGGTLKILLDANTWNSTISFGQFATADLEGKLALDFTDGVDVSSQIGRTFDLFDWTNVTTTGQFEVDSPYVWDLSQLYTTGDVTLISVPEPSAYILGVIGIVTLIGRRRRLVFSTIRCSIHHVRQEVQRPCPT